MAGIDESNSEVYYEPPVIDHENMGPFKITNALTRTHFSPVEKKLSTKINNSGLSPPIKNNSSTKEFSSNIIREMIMD